MTHVRVAGVYSGFVDEMEMPPELDRPLRRADEFIRAAVLAAGNTLTGLLPAEKAGNIGLFLVTGYGTMQTTSSVLDQILDDNLTSPVLFAHSVFNAAAGYIAAIFDIRGCALTLTEFTFPFLRSLQEGVLSLKNGNLDRCLVLHVETFSRLLRDLRRREGGNTIKDWRGGATCWLLEAVEKRDGRSLHVEDMWFEDRECSSNSILLQGEVLQLGESTVLAESPLSYGFLATEAVLQPDTVHDITLQAEAPWGRAGLLLGR